MRVARALLRRSAVQAGQLLAVLLVAAVGAGAVVALIALPAAAVDRGVEALVAEAEPTAGALRVDTALARDDPGAQDARVRDALADAVGEAPLSLVRAVRSEPVPASVGGAERSIVLGSQEGLDRLAELIAGDWATGDGEVTLAEPAAAALGVGVGDPLVFSGEQHRVVGVWRARDAADPAWFGETLVASGRLGDAVGPVIVPDAELAGLEARPRVTWTLVPDASALTADALPSLAPVEGRVRAATSGLASGTSYAVTVSGGLAATVARAEQAVAAARVLSATAVVLALVTAGIVLALVARALGQVRAAEWRLLEARGLSRGRGAALRFGEAAIAVGLGVALGVVASVLIAAATDAAVPVAAVLAAAVAGLAGVALVAAASRPAVAARRGIAETDSIVPALGVTALAAFVLVTASAVPASPVRYLGPSLALVAGVLVLRLLLAPLMRLAERVAARGTGLLPVLPLRQLGRRPRAVASAFLVVALGAGAVVVAGLAGGAVARDDDAQVRAAVGGDVRIRFSGVDRDPVSAGPYAALDGVEGATEVALVDAQAGSTSVGLVVAGGGFAAVTGVAAPPAGEELRVRVAPALATRLGVGVGDDIPLSVPGIRSPLTAVVAQLGTVPGAGGGGMLVDRDALGAQVPADAAALAVDEVWLASDAPERAAALARAASDRAATVLTPAGASTRAVTEAGTLAVAASAALVVLVALGGFAAAAAGLARLRRGEVTPLRALGVGAGAQARGRLVELLLTALAGALAGGLAGAVATWLAVGGAVAVADLASLAPLVLGAVLLIGVLLIAAGAGAGVRRRAGVGS